MSTSRLEAFSDGVIAIIITLMMLNINIPSSPSFKALLDLHQLFFIYVVSFLTLAVYWINHHHIFQASEQISGRVLWLNILFLLFASVIPFTTDWFGMHLEERAPALFYGLVILAADMIWLGMAHELRRIHGKESIIGRSLQSFRKSYITIALILMGLVVGYFFPMAVLFFCLLSLIPWVVPDKYIEAQLFKNSSK